MDEQFETRPLLEPADLRMLITRRTWPSLVRLTLHFLAFALLGYALTANAEHAVLALPLAIALAWVWSGLFAPFHECTHRTAFRSALGNRLGAAITGVLFGMAPAVYRTFHYEHHRYTQDVARDPELSGDPRYAQWPPTLPTWLIAMSGYGLIMLKLRPLVGFAIKPRSAWATFAAWEKQIDNPAQLVLECRMLLGLWSLFIVVALFNLPAGGWWLFAAWFTHVFQVLWVSAEHTGLPLEGTIIARTRTVATNPWVRFWLWNMNYHAEHHAWPAIPWHQLPAAHTRVAPKLESFETSYTALHRGVMAGWKA